ncbi:MAG: PAS domain S-box protein [Salinigranum sp.]
MDDDTGGTIPPSPRIDERTDALTRYQSIVDTVGEAIYQLDLDGRFVAVNDVVTEVTGYSREELLGEHASLLVADDDLARFESTVRALLTGERDGVQTVEASVETVDGGTVPCEVRMRLYEADGEVRGTVGVARDVSDRRERERKLTESRRRLATTFGNLPGMVYRCRYDPDWTMEFVSDGCADLTGYDPVALTDGDVSWGADVIHPDDRDGVRSAVQDAMDDDGAFEFTYRIVRADGETRWVRERGRGAFEDGDLATVEGYVTDVTDSKREEDERTLLLNLARTTAEAGSGEEAIRRAVDEVCEHTEFACGEVWLPDEAGRLRRDYDAAADVECGTFSEASAGTTFAPEEGLVGRVYASADPEWIPDVSAASESTYLRGDAAADAGLGAALGVPVTVDGEVFAAVVFYLGEASERREHLTDVVATTVRQLGTDVARKRSARELDERERQFRTLVQNVEEYAIFRLDPDGYVTSWNEGARNIKGYDADEIIGEHFSVFYTDEAVADGAPEENLAAAAERGDVVDEGWRVRKDGSRFWANVTITALYDDDGDLDGFAKVTRDMTERREHEEELRRQRELTEEMIRTVPIPLTVMSADGEVLMANRRAQGVLDLTEDELTGGGVDADEWALYDGNGDPLDPSDSPVQRVMATGEPVVNQEIAIERPDGERTWLSVNAAPVPGPDGETERIVEAGEDVTRLKEQADRLERQRDELEAELDEVFSRVSEAFFAVDGEWRFTYVNERAEDLVDVEATTVVGSTFWDVFPEAVGSTFEEEYRRAMETQEPVTFEEYYPPLATWLEVRAYPSETGLSVYFRDVTDRKERERELERYETVVETVKDGIYGVDGEGRFTMVNDAYASMLGYDAADLLGRHVSTVVDDEIHRRAREVERRLSAGESQTETLQATLETAGGEELIAEATFALLPSGDGMDRVGVVRDVTERVERERELEQHRALTESANDVIVTIDESSTIRSVNPAVRDVFGYDPDELAGASLTTIIPDELTERHGEALDRYLDTGERNLDWDYIELPGRHRDGHEVPLGLSFSKIEYQGEQFFTGVLRDITERKERERELEQFHQTMETIDDGVYVLDDETRFAMVNDALCRMTGYDRDELLGEPATLVADEEDVVHGDRVVRELAATDREVVTIEEEIHTVEGETIPVENRLTRLPREGGDWRVGVVRDVTERKERERELLRYQSVIRTTDDGVYMLDEDDRFVLVSDAYCEMSGYDREDLLGEEASVVLTDETTETVADLSAEMRAGERDVSVLEFELQRADGGTVPAESHFGLYEFEDGGVGRTGVVRDVTERKERERQLERYETIVENLWDGVYALDPDGNYALVNEAYCELTGYDREEILGSPGSRVTGDEISTRAAHLAESIADGDRSGAVIEWELDPVDGEPIPAEARLGRYPYDEDRDGRVGVVRDVTDRVRYEETLRALHESLRRLINAETAPAVDDLVIEALADTLDLSGAVIYRYDPKTELLSPEAASVEAGFMSEELPSVPPDDTSITGHVYASGESVRHRDVADSPYLQSNATEMRSGIFVPLGDHGVLIVGATDSDTFDERTQQLVELVAATAEAAYDRVDHEEQLRAREQELAVRVRQQQGVADLGKRALETDDLDSLMYDASRLVADVLGNDYCKVLELFPDEGELLLRQGVGWHDGVVGEATVASNEDSQAGYTLDAEEPVIVDDLDAETRFSGPDLLTNHDVVSGISVVIGSADDPWGILGTHHTARREFTWQDAHFVQTVANVLASAIDRTEHERELRQRGEQLEALNDLNAVVREITRATVQQSTREEIERLVCERLAETESYMFSWIGTVDAARGRVEVRTEAGVEGYLDDLEITYDSGETSRGPTGRAIRSREMQVSSDPESSDYRPWREHARQYGFESTAAIPIVYENTLYGVLNVYSARSDAFDGQEGAVIGQLGEVVGHAIASIERKEALMSDDVIEIELEIQDVFDTTGIETTPEGVIDLERTVPAGTGAYLVYGRADEEGMASLRAIVEDLPHWESIDVVSERNGETRFEVRLSEPPVVSLVASQGGRVRSAAIEGGDYRMTVHIPHSADVRTLVDGIRDTYPDAEVIAQRQTTSHDGGTTSPDASLLSDLTERQRAALEAAYYAGFFEWPRDSTGEDVADSLDISAATFHQHLRTGERKLLTALLADG